MMHLIQPSYLGTGYHVYLNNFYTSPQLFLNLASMTSGACGTYRDNRKGCPTGRENALTRKSERGTVRWIREGSLVFVKWMDTWEVSIGSTIHPAVSREVVKRRVKEKDGHWAVKNISCPALIIACIMGLTCLTSCSSIILPIAEPHAGTAPSFCTLWILPPQVHTFCTVTSVPQIR